MSCTVQDGKSLEWVIKSAQNIFGYHPLTIRDVGEMRFLPGNQTIVKHNSHPIHSPLTQLLSDGWYSSIHLWTTRLPSTSWSTAVRDLNSSNSPQLKYLWFVYHLVIISVAVKFPRNKNFLSQLNCASLTVFLSNLDWHCQEEMKTIIVCRRGSTSYPGSVWWYIVYTGCLTVFCVVL